MSGTDEDSESHSVHGVARGLLLGWDAAFNSRQRVRALRDAAALGAVDEWCWVEAGPEGFATAAGQGSVMGSQPVSGLVQDIHFDTQWLYGATSYGGVWRTASAPALAPIPVPPPATAPTFAWEPVTEALPALSVNTLTGRSAVAADGSPVDVLVLGTGDPYTDQRESAPCAGLFRSVDGGRSFAPLDGGQPASAFVGDDVNEIVALGPREWLVATRSGLHRSTDDGRTFARLDEANVQDVKVVFDGLPTGVRARATYAVREQGLRRFDFPTGGGAPVRHRVGGADWAWRPGTVANQQPGDVAFDLRRVEPAPGDGPPGTGPTELAVVSVGARDTSVQGAYHSLQYGLGTLAGVGTWAPLAAAGLVAPGSEPQTHYDHVVAVDPRWTNLGLGAWFWIGHVDLFTATIPPGATFALAQAGAGTVHDDHHVIEPAPPSTKSAGGGPITPVLVGNDGGLVFTDDGGTTWRALSATRSALFYGLHTVALPGGHVALLGGLQDNGTAFGSTEPTTPAGTGPAIEGLGPAQWRQLSGGDGGTALLLPTTTGGRDLVAFLWVNDRLERHGRATGGAWSALETSLITPAPNSNFMGVLAGAMDASGAWNTVFASLGTDRFGGARLFVCTTALAASLPQSTAPTPAFAQVPGATWSQRITAMVAVPPPPGGSGAWSGLWIGHVDGRLRHSANALAATPRWEDHTPPGNDRPIGGIALDPRDSRVVVVTTTRYAGRPSRYKTGRVWLRAPDASGRLVWTDISGRDGSDGTNLPDAPAYGVAITATSPRWIVVGTEVGAFATNDDGQTWRRLDLAMRRDGAVRRFGRLPLVPVYGVASPEVPTTTAAATLPRLAIGTYGRGTWVLQSLASVARAAVPAVTVDADGAFGFVANGATTTRRWSIANRGSAPAQLVSATVTGPFGLGGTSPPPAPGGAPIPLGVGQRWAFDLSCAPTATGIATGELTITTTAPDQPTITVPLSCDAVADATPRLGTVPIRGIDFGPLSSSVAAREERLVLHNVGTGPLTVQGIDVEPALDAHVSVHDVPASPIPPGGTATVRVRFDPGGALWPAMERTLVLRTNAPGEARRVTVTGGEAMPLWAQIVLGVVGVGLAVTVIAVIVDEAT